MFGWLVREEVLPAGLYERKILFRLKIYDYLRQATAKRIGLVGAQIREGKNAVPTLQKRFKKIAIFLPSFFSHLDIRQRIRVRYMKITTIYGFFLTFFKEFILLRYKFIVRYRNANHSSQPPFMFIYDLYA